MGADDKKPVFVVYKSNKPIEEKFAFIIVNYCATGLTRWKEWILLVPEIEATSSFQPRTPFKLTKENVESLSPKFTGERLEGEALKFAEGVLYSYLHQNPIGQHDREIFAELYLPNSGEALNFNPVDSRHGLGEIIFDGTEANRELLRRYRDSVHADEPLPVEITECLRIWEWRRAESLRQLGLYITAWMKAPTANNWRLMTDEFGRVSHWLSLKPATEISKFVQEYVPKGNETKTGGEREIGEKCLKLLPTTAPEPS